VGITNCSCAASFDTFLSRKDARLVLTLTGAPGADQHSATALLRHYVKQAKTNASFCNLLYTGLFVEHAGKKITSYLPAKGRSRMRYFAELAYNGSQYFGWQKQPDQVSVQSTLEQAFSTILSQPVEVVGCGRTDTGVHARQYFLHVDYGGTFPPEFERRMNKFLPPDIAVYRIFAVEAEAHARFDASSRGYSYYLHLRKDPFQQQTSYFYPFADRTSQERMAKAAELLLGYEAFYPFCKSNTDAKTMHCQLEQSTWEFSEHEWVFHITANRFLRGMVRLIVGMCLNVGLGKVQLEEVEMALQKQIRLKKSWSAPPEGLYLRDIRYPFVQ